MIQVGEAPSIDHPIRVILDLGEPGDQPNYDLDRDQARFLVHQLQVALARELQP
jgi:hypothetical protein